MHPPTTSMDDGDDDDNCYQVSFQFGITFSCKTQYFIFFLFVKWLKLRLKVDSNFFNIIVAMENFVWELLC